MPWPEQATVLMVAAGVIIVLRLLNFYFPRGRHSKRVENYSVPGPAASDNIVDALRDELNMPTKEKDT